MKKKSWIREWLEALLDACVMMLLVKTFVLQSCKIPTGSMEPTLHGDMKYGDRVFVSKFSHIMHPIQRGDIVVFSVARIKGLDPAKTYVKRLVGLPGDKLEIRDGHIYINDRQLEFPDIFRYNQYYNLPYEQGSYGLTDTPVIVPENCYFVLGDNSGSSYDSRFWGFVPKESVMGTVLLIYWPFPRFHVFVRPHPRLNLYLNSTTRA